MSADNSSDSLIVNISAYQFVDLQDLPSLRETLIAHCMSLRLLGTILLSVEGINLNLAGLPADIDAFCQDLHQDPRFSAMQFKKSHSSFVPFKRLLIKIKPEIITFKEATVRPLDHTVPHLPPKQLKDWLDAGKKLLLLDTRNAFELNYGTFKGAEHVGLKRFSDWSQAASEGLDETMKDVPVVTFCTGGVRCEKAGPLLENLGFREVYQLDGGILAYFEECGGAHYDGDCFVFDERIALDPELNATRKTDGYEKHLGG